MTQPTNNRFITSYDTDHVSMQEALALHNDMAAGFLHGVTNATIKASEVQHFIESVQAQFGSLALYDFSRSRNSTEFRYENECVKIYLSGNAVDLVVEMHAKTQEDSQRLWKIFVDCTEDDTEVQVFVHSYSMNGSAMDVRVRVMEPKEFERISWEFYPYIDIPVMFDRFFTGHENILLLVGEPGLGKSKMSTAALKYAHSNPDKLPYDKKLQDPGLDEQYIVVAYVKSPEVLASDAFWRSLQSDPPDFCILDDQDFMLTRRDAEVRTRDDSIKNSFLNQFLSYTDGVERNNTKFIITTNQNYDHIDTAVLRKGRLFDIIELRHLTNEEALAIWIRNGLQAEEFYEMFNTERILPAELGSEISKRKNERIAGAQTDYILEEGISKLKKVCNKTRIGL